VNREELLARTLVDLADTLVDDFDVVELLVLLVERSVALLDAAAAGLLLADEDGRLRLMASTSDAAEVVELFEVQHDQGPCFDCWRTGEPIVSTDLSEAVERWPAFVPIASGVGFRAAHAFPVRLRRRVLGTLNLFRTEPGALSPADAAAGRALADVAAISICQVRAIQDAQLVTDQLQHALQSRIAIEQAKGMLAERAGLAMDEAFSRLRGYARNSHRLLVDVAHDVVSGVVPPDDVLSRFVEKDAGRR
jgi:GAF domain-containing protein